MATPPPATPAVSPIAGLEERISVHRGRRVRYLVGGEGPPLLLTHGFLGSAENFETWFPAVCQRRTVIAPDLPGCGASAPLPGSHRAEALAEAVMAVADDAGVARFDLAGLCLGSSVALSVVRQWPARVRSLILHTPLLSPVLVRRRFHLQVGMMTAPGVFPAIVWLSRRRVVSDLYKRLMVEGDDVDERAALVNFQNQCRADPRATREWLRDGLRRDDMALLAERAAPSLVLVAGDDRIVDVPALRSLVESLPGVELAVLEEAGHGWTGEYVRRQLAVVTAFLDRPLVPLVDRGAAVPESRPA